MAQLDRTQLKAKFENGDIPTQADFADLIDSLALKSEISESTGGFPTPNIVSGRVLYSGFLPYYRFNHGISRGILGTLSSKSYLNQNHTSVYLDTYYGVSSLNIPGSITYKSNEVSKDISIRSLSNSKTTSLNEVDHRLYEGVDSFYCNNTYRILGDLLPIEYSGSDAELFIDCFGLQDDGARILNSLDGSPLEWDFDDPDNVYKITFGPFESDFEITTLTAFINWKYDIDADDWHTIDCLDKTLQTGNIVIEAGTTAEIYFPLPTDIYNELNSQLSDTEFLEAIPGISFDMQFMYEGNGGYSALIEDDLQTLEEGYNGMISGGWCSGYSMDITGWINDVIQ